MVNRHTLCLTVALARLLFPICLHKDLQSYTGLLCVPNLRFQCFKTSSLCSSCDAYDITARRDGLPYGRARKLCGCNGAVPVVYPSQQQIHFLCFSSRGPIWAAASRSQPQPPFLPAAPESHTMFQKIQPPPCHCLRHRTTRLQCTSEFNSA